MNIFETPTHRYSLSQVQGQDDNSGSGSGSRKAPTPWISTTSAERLNRNLLLEVLPVTIPER
jgi:hypothetical protein